MKLGKWLENWDLQKLKINLGFLETEWNPQEKDREAAWELYVEMLTRVVTQPLPQEHGDEQTALGSIHSLFGVTREVLRRKGRECQQCTKIAIIVLNQIVRPFTAEWHKRSLAGAFNDPAQCEEFRKALGELHYQLSEFSRALANIAEVEDLTKLESM